MQPTMMPLADCRREILAAVEGVLTDIDETVSTHGRLTAEAYGALEALKKAGLLVIPGTGRPAGWCDHIARFWPVEAVLGENGAFWMWRGAPKAKTSPGSPRHPLLPLSHRAVRGCPRPRKGWAVRGRHP